MEAREEEGNKRDSDTYRHGEGRQSLEEEEGMSSSGYLVFKIS